VIRWPIGFARGQTRCAKERLTLGDKTRVHVFQADQTVHHQSCADQQHVGECHLRGDKSAAQQATAGELRSMARIFLQAVGHFGVRVQGRKSAADDGGRRGARDGKPEDPAIDRDLPRTRSELRGEARQQGHAAAREADSHRGRK
jgi:hypothetical protein